MPKTSSGHTDYCAQLTINHNSIKSVKDINIFHEGDYTMGFTYVSPLKQSEQAKIIHLFWLKQTLNLECQDVLLKVQTHLYSCLSFLYVLFNLFNILNLQHHQLLLTSSEQEWTYLLC